MPQYVRLVNKDTKPFQFFLPGGHERIIAPGGDAMVPWGTACSWLGDPTLIDMPKDPQRTRCHSQVRGYYGYQVGIETTAEWEARRPHVEVYDVETGDRVYMIIEDPEGKITQNLDLDASMGEQEVMQRQIALLTQRLNELAAQTTATPAATPEGQTATVSVDSADPMDDLLDDEPVTLSLSVPPAAPSVDMPSGPAARQLVAR